MAHLGSRQLYTVLLVSLAWPLTMVWSVSVHLVANTLTCIDHDMNPADVYAVKKTREFAPCFSGCVADENCVGFDLCQSNGGDDLGGCRLKNDTRAPICLEAVNSGVICQHFDVVSITLCCLLVTLLVTTNCRLHIIIIFSVEYLV
jgi:hypothetical protein